MKQLAALLFSITLMVHISACGKNDARKNADQVSKPPVAVDVRSASLSALSDGIEVTGSLEPKFSVDVKTHSVTMTCLTRPGIWVFTSTENFGSRLPVTSIPSDRTDNDADRTSTATGGLET